MRRWLAVLALLLGASPLAAAQRYTVRSIPVGVYPEQPIVVPEWNAVAVPIGGQPFVALIDVPTDRVFAQIPTAAPTDRLVWDASRGWLLALMHERIEAFERTAFGFARVAAVATNIKDLVWSAELNPGNGTLVVTDRHRLGFLELASFSYRPAGELEGVNQIVLDASGRTAWVAEEDTGQIVALDARDLTTRLLTVSNYRPQAVAYSPSRHRLYAVTPWIALLQIIDADSGEDEFATIAEGAFSLAVDEGPGQVYVGHRSSPVVTRVDAATRQSSFLPLPTASQMVLLDPGAGRLYALDVKNSLVNVVSTAAGACETSWRVGGAPRYGVVEPGSGKLYTANHDDGTVSVLMPLPDPDQSEFVVSDEFIAADGLSVSRATVTPRASDGSPLGPGHEVRIRTTAGTLLGTVTDAGDGTYWQDLRSTTTVETGILTADVDDVRITPRPRVSFTRDGWPDSRVPEPEWGFTAGGTSVRLTGRGFTSELRAGSASLAVVEVTVSFGGSPARIDSLSDTEIVCTTSAHPEGVVDIVVSKKVGDELREGILRQGFTYTSAEQLSLLATRGDVRDEVVLRWSQGPSGPVQAERSSAKDFSRDVTSLPGLLGPEVREIAPAFPRVLYYRIER